MEKEMMTTGSHLHKPKRKKDYVTGVMNNTGVKKRLAHGEEHDNTHSILTLQFTSIFEGSYI